MKFQVFHVIFLTFALSDVCMGDEGKSKTAGVLESYLEDSGLVEFVNGEAVSLFEHVEPESREPDGFFDYVLQTFADFASEDMGGRHTLEFSTDREVFDTYTKVQKLNTSLLYESIMDRYGFDIEDPYQREGFNQGKTELGNSLSILVGQLDYDGKISTHRGNEYEKGLTEEQIDQAIESFYDP